MAGLEVITAGDLLRELAKEDSDLGRLVKKHIDAGEFVPDSLISDLIKGRIARVRDRFILDGYPRSLAQAADLEQVTTIDVIIRLDVPDELIVERLAGRQTCEKCGKVYNVKSLKPKVEGVCDVCGGALVGRADDAPETVKARLDTYREQTAPLIEHYQNKIPFVTFRCDSPNITADEGANAILKRLSQLGFV
jgi:adenylate kinase